MLRWNVARSRSVAADVRGRFLERFAARITSDGELVLACDRHRERERNRDDCLERLRRMLAAAASPPKPRRKTRAPRTAAERRLRDKRMRAETKERRRTLD
jgi:ribosome-associated protein